MKKIIFDVIWKFIKGELIKIAASQIKKYTIYLAIFLAILVAVLFFTFRKAHATAITVPFPYGASWLDTADFCIYQLNATGSSYDSVGHFHSGTYPLDTTIGINDTSATKIKVKGTLDDASTYVEWIDISPMASLPNNGITSSKIAADAIGASELADNAIDSLGLSTTYWAAMQNDSASHARSSWDNDIVAEANRLITIPTDGITNTKIATDAIGASEIAADAITSSEIATDAIGEIEIATSAIGNLEIAPDAIGSSEIATGAIDADAIAADAITAAGIAADAIGSSEIAADAIGSSELATTSVDEMVDATWDEPGTGHLVGDKMGYYASQTAASSLDSQTVADIVKAFVWGISGGSNDSTALSLRKVRAYCDSLAWNSITANVIAASAITSSEAPNLDAQVSTRSTLSATDNIGLNLSDISGSWTGGNFGDSYWDSIANRSDSGVAGGGGGATATEIMDSLYHRLVSDTVTNSYMARLLRVTDSIDAQVSTRSTLAATDNIGINLSDISGSWAGENFGDSYWDSLANRSDSGVAGGGGGATATEIMDSLYHRLVSDTVTNSYMARLLRATDSIDAKVSTAGSVASISDADMASIADTLFAKAIGDTVAGKYMAALLRSRLSGYGAYTRYIYVIDTSGTDSTIHNAPVTINNLAQNTNPFFALTNNNGRATFNLDTGYWVIITNPAGYASRLDTIHVSATGTDTLFTFNSSANKTTVFGILQDASGNRYEYAQVIFKLIGVPDDSSIEYNDTIITQTMIYDTADINGYFSLTIYANENLSDSSFYKATFRDRYGVSLDKYNWNCTVPDTAVINFLDVIRWRR